MCGFLLFFYYEFIKSLSADRNIFKKVWDEIKYLCKVAVSGSKEARELARVEKMFAKVYEESVRGTKNTDTEDGGNYSIAKTSKMSYLEQLAKIEKGTLNGSNSLYIGIPNVRIKGVFSDSPFAMNQKDYRKSRRESAKNKNYSSHSVPLEFFKVFPQEINTAPMIFDNGNKATIITSYSMKDTNGKDSFVIAGVWKNQQMENDTVNLVKSVYPLDDFKELIIKYAESGNLLVTDKNKAEQMLTTIGIQPAEVSRLLNLTKDIVSQANGKINDKIVNNNIGPTKQSIAPIKESVSPAGVQGDLAPTKDTDITGEQFKRSENIGPVREDVEVLSYTDKEKANWKNSNTIIVYENEQQFDAFVKDALNNENTQKKIYFGKIPDSTAQMVLDKTGIDVSGHNIALKGYEIRKILLHSHGEEAREISRGQEPITAEDLKNIPSIITNPDNVLLSDKEYEGKPVLVFEKNINGKNYVVAYVSKKHKDIGIQTMYKKRSLATAENANALSFTPKATNSTASKNSISQESENVNKETKAENIAPIKAPIAPIKESVSPAGVKGDLAPTKDTDITGDEFRIKTAESVTETVDSENVNTQEEKLGIEEELEAKLEDIKIELIKYKNY